MKAHTCRAARALLNWTQEDLAAKSGASLTAIKRFENGVGEARKTSLQAMHTALEKAGVSFTADGGIRLVEDEVKTYRFSGRDFIEKHNALIYMRLQHEREELLTCSPDDSNWTSPLARDSNTQFKSWREKLDIRGKTLAPEGTLSFNEPRHQYRFLPKEVIGTLTYVIYGDCVSFILWKQKKAFVVCNPSIAQTFRKQFEFLWHLAKK